MPEVITILEKGLGNASYFLDLGDGHALVMDPARDPRPYVREARERGIRIAFAAETHLHNDFVSGSRELAELGATVLAGSEAELQFAHRPVRDLEEMDLGGLTLRALATPGHTPEHVSYLVLDGATPVVVFTGGALLKGSVARTDLLGEDRAEPLAKALLGSLIDRLLTLPDDTEVRPTHGVGGSTFCAVGPVGDGSTTTTIGHERATNPFLSPLEERSFVSRLRENRSIYPNYFRSLREINRRGPRVIGDDVLALDVLTPLEVRETLSEGALLVDARPIRDYAAGHVRGAISIEFRPVFATWLGWLVKRDRPILLVVAQDQDRIELVRQCLSIGFENLVGELDGDADAWGAAGLPVGAVETIGATGISTDTVLDVRQRSEFEAAQIPGALNVELGSLDERADAVPAGPLTVHCSHGARAMTAASLLERHGREDVSVLLGRPEDVTEARKVRREVADPG
jgi:glyoxylase-like metal-dependent hydrolase (beta-lactamase superfamily II)/rhodanese-related sulfurtransferase